MLNRCEFIGRLGADPEQRSMQDGSSVVNMRVAVSETWRDKNSGERREKTEWVPIVIWNDKIGEVAMKYLRKGSQCFVAGQLQTRKWTDQDGNDRYSTEVVLQRFRGELTLIGGRGDDQGGHVQNDPAESQSGSGGGGHTDLDDEIPFARFDDEIIRSRQERLIGLKPTEI